MNRLHLLLITVTLSSPLLTAGCQSVTKTLHSAEQIASSGSVKTAVEAAVSKDPSAVLKHRVERYKTDPAAALRDLNMVKGDFDRLMGALTGNVKKTWGKKEVKLPERTKYIKYTQNYRSRAVVDFDAGTITVETLDEKDPAGSLTNAIVTTLLTPDDPRAVDLFSDKNITLTSDKPPYLLGLVLDDRGRPVRTPDQADAFAAYLMDKQAGRRTVDVDGAKKPARYVTMSMVPNLGQKQAEKYLDLVSTYAKSYQISPSLVFAIIRTESNFNPFAVSSAPAYGLMQLVPSSGGREGYRRAKGKDTMPSRDYLFDPAHNIELGTALLNVLAYDQLDPVSNPVSREYCVIAAYNTGAGNVYRTFSKDQVTAVNEINRLHPGDLYDTLRAKLPYEETRNYLDKVVNYRKEFVSVKPSNE
jgi:membrane-bound lytic murein transglycosylase C